jgi:hypothetical protein
LILDEFHRCGALLVIIRHMVDPSVHGIALHQVGVEELQQVGHESDVQHSRIEQVFIQIPSFSLTRGSFRWRRSAVILQIE